MNGQIMTRQAICYLLSDSNSTTKPTKQKTVQYEEHFRGFGFETRDEENFTSGNDTFMCSLKI